MSENDHNNMRTPPHQFFRRVCHNCGTAIVVECADCDALSETETGSITKMIEQSRMSEDLAKIRVGIERLTVQLDGIDKRANEDRAEIAAIRKDISGFPPQILLHDQRINAIEGRVAKIENGTGEFVKKILSWVLVGVLTTSIIGLATVAGYKLIPNAAAVSTQAK